MRLFGAFLVALLATGSVASTAQAPDTDQATIQIYEDYNIALVDDLFAEKTPRAMVLAATALPDDSPEDQAQAAKRSELLSTAAQLAPDDASVQWFAALFSEPDTSISAPARALFRLEPDNGATWLFALQAAREANDEKGMTHALARMGRSSVFDDHIADFTLQWEAWFRTHPLPTPKDPGKAMFDKPLIMAIARSSALAMPAYRNLVASCRETKTPLPEGRLEACVSAGRLMASQSSSLASRNIGIVLLELGGASDFVGRRRNFEYFIYEYTLLSNSLICDPDEFDHFRSDWLETGNEVEVAQRMLERARRPLTPPAEWKPDSDVQAISVKSACAS